MIQIRSTLFFIFLLLFTPVYAVMCFIFFPFMNASRRYDLVSGWNITVVQIAKSLCKINYTIKGAENLEKMIDKPVVLLSKHQSAWETIAFIALMPKQLCFVFKRELLWIPFFGWALGMLKMIHIDRSKGAAAAHSIASQGKKHLADGNWIIIFPEGTRTARGSNPNYRKGGAKLASNTGAWVIPIAHNAGQCWPRNSFLKSPGTITVSIGEPMNTATMSAEEVHQKTVSWIESEMRVIDPQAYAPK